MSVKIILTNGNEHTIPDLADVTGRVITELSNLNISSMVAAYLTENGVNIDADDVEQIVSSALTKDDSELTDNVISIVEGCFATGSSNAFETAVINIVNEPDNKILYSSNTALQDAVRFIVNEFCFSTADGTSSFEPALVSILNDPRNPVLDSSNEKLQNALKDYLKYEAQVDSATKLIAINPSGSKFEGYNIDTEGDFSIDNHNSIATIKSLTDLESALIDDLTCGRTTDKADVYIPEITVLEDEALPASGTTGDYCIIKDTKAGTQTAYMYMEDHWEALNGNYDATNIYFNDNFTITEKFGKYDPAGATMELKTAEQSLWWLLQNAFATDKNPARISSPQISWATKPEGTVEVGTEVTPAYKVSLTSGSYTYGPATGITAKGWTISINNTGETAKTVAESSFNTFIVTDGMSSYARVQAKTSHDAGAIPLTLLKNEYDNDGSNDVRILANDNLTSTTNGYTGYRAYFYGITNETELTSADAVTNYLQNNPGYLSDLVRTGTFKNNGNSGIPSSFHSGTAFTEKPAKWQQMYFLVPRNANGTSNTSYKVKNLLNKTGTVDPGTVHCTTSYIKGLNSYAIAENIEGNNTNTTAGWLYDVYFITTANAADHDTWNITKGN